MPGFTSNIFQVRRIMNSQTVNQNRFTVRFVGLQAMLAQIVTAGSTYAQRRPALYNKMQELKNAMRWYSDGDLEGGTFDQNNISPDDITQTGMEDVLEVSLLSATLPSVQMETQAIAKFNDSARAVTKFAEMEDFTVTFYDYIDGSASTIMEVWRSLVGDKTTGAISYREEYVLDTGLFYVYGPDAPGQPFNPAKTGKQGWVDWVQCYKLVNLFPRQVNLGEHSMENGEARKVEVTFSIDNVYQIGARHYNYSNDEYTAANVGGFYENERDISYPSWGAVDA